MEKTNDFFADHDTQEAALHTAELLNYNDAYTQAYRLTKDQAEIDLTRFSEVDAMSDYGEMVSLRSLPEIPSHLLCLVDMELNAR